MLKTLLVTAVVLFNVVAIDAGERVSVRVSPRMAHAPADIIIYVYLERHADNRALRVSAESSDFYRSSEVALEGEGSARVTVLHFRELPSGSYDVNVDVMGLNGQTRERARCELTVV